MELLDQKAAAQVQVELAKQQTLTLNEQLNQTKAQTAIDVEIANRKNQITAIQAQAYEDSPQMLELRKLELMATVMGPNAKWVLCGGGTAGCDPTMIFSDSSNTQVISVQP
jgi:hypothetical protein